VCRNVTHTHTHTHTFVTYVFRLAHLHCKGQSGWDDSFFESIDLKELVEERYERIGGNRVEHMGKAVANGLTQRAAQELGM
jgi:ribulose kinase